jgi:hypothetical protein
MTITKVIVLISFFLFVLMSCVTQKYHTTTAECLTNKPNWKTYYDVLPLRDLLIRVDSLAQNRKIKESLWGNTISFDYYDLYVTMDRQTTSRPLFGADFNPEYTAQMVKINLFISDTLDDSVIANLKKEASDRNIEKGYIGNSSFLYINDYNNRDSYFLLNLHSKKAYRLMQDVENAKYTYRSLNAFVKNGCLQGIQFIAKDGAYSLGDYLMF